MATTFLATPLLKLTIFPMGSIFLKGRPEGSPTVGTLLILLVREQVRYVNFIWCEPCFLSGLFFVEFAAEMLGFEESIPPYANSTKEDYIGGVNYASGGAGIQNETGRDDWVNSLQVSCNFY